ncbi:hypothetical protein [Pseudohaliea rubra]|uniref:Uncharacterized protein n=1 Tax=Pseudohaliea rubra DSM 19751 TaxID=1265313 RepID=A0A095WVS6_9GAMM|nr:hypothetical protein [Pseudohaliea rubra]KGE02749.1 hypothetical protein HRUBRA_02727 [Pseudohaliea rubra DSM 19751]
MSTLSPRETAFLRRRERLLRYWPWVGGGLLWLLGCLLLWLWFEVPYLVNPRALARAVEAGELSEQTILMLATMLPVVFLTLLLAVALFLAMLLAVFGRERRLLRLLRRHHEKDE